MNSNLIATLRSEIGAAHAKIQNQAAAVQQMQGEQALMRQQLGVADQQMKTLAAALGNVQQVGGGAGKNDTGQVAYRDQIMYIDQIPGRRIPFDMLVSIPIGANIDSAQQQSITVSQDGPFVAVARYAVFQSAHTFNRLVDSVRVTFNGRSNGRYRPVHSVCDFIDSQAFQPVVGLANPGTGGPIYASPSNHSGFRTMEWDGVIEFLNEGSGYFRHNNPVPSAFWTDQQNAAFQLGALDFFERGESLQFRATPGHINNPNSGNVNAFIAGNVFPTLASQYDVHEGILDESDAQLSADPVTRTPDGILIVGFHGFKILQPPGPVRMS